MDQFTERRLLNMAAPKLQPPYLLFLGSAKVPLDCKTARGMLEWRPDLCLGECALADCEQTLGLPRLTPGEAAERGVKTLLIGTVSAGGQLPAAWLNTLSQAIEAGLNVASGMHQFLRHQDTLATAAARANVELLDVRDPLLWTERYNSGKPFEVATGAPRAGLRLLTVGTDCSVGKMYTWLAIERYFLDHGVAAEFKATGQTGIFIAGEGVPVDAMVSDFIAGSVEALSAADDGALHVIEGQGSLHHPGFAGVSLGLLHGSQPDYIVVCHEPTRAHMRHLPHFQQPSLQETVELNLLHARRTNPNARVVGFSINTQHLDAPSASALLQEVGQTHGLPAVDPSRTGLATLLDPLLPELPPNENT